MIKAKFLKLLTLISLLSTQFNFNTTLLVKGYAYRHQGQVGVYYTKTSFEKAAVPDYNNSAFYRSFKAVDSRNINQVDYENKYIDTYGASSSQYLNKTCVITATTIIVDYYARKNNYNLNTFSVYTDILDYAQSYNYFDNGVSFSNIGNILNYALSTYKIYTGISYSVKENKSNIFSNITSTINNDDIALYVFSPYDYPHAMVVCGYVNLDVTLASGSTTTVNGIVVNDVVNNYNPSNSFSMRWYNETDSNYPAKDEANFSFIPETEAVSGKDYFWTVR